MLHEWTNKATILFYSILFYSILLYSILFYSLAYNMPVIIFSCKLSILALWTPDIIVYQNIHYCLPMVFTPRHPVVKWAASGCCWLYHMVRGEGEIFLRDSGHYVNNDGVILVAMAMRKHVQWPLWVPWEVVKAANGWGAWVRLDAELGEVWGGLAYYDRQEARYKNPWSPFCWPTLPG